MREVQKIVMAEHSVPAWQRAVIVLTGAVVGFLIVLTLQWGRPVLIPVALAVLLTFLLNPVVKKLHRYGLNHLLSVMLTVSAAGIVLICLGWMVTTQISSMIGQLPENTAKIKAKLKAVKQLGSGPTRERIGQMVEEISQEIYPSPKRSEDSDQEVIDEKLGIDPRSGPIVVQTESTRWLSLTRYVGSAFEVLATLAFALVLLVFFLIEREDLRDRVVLLAGRAKLAVTSKAVEDITDRVSRYIGMVALVNGGFGLVLTFGLLAMNVPFALLWGLIAATLRFIPYIGPWIGAVFPITISLATSDGWMQPIAVFVFVLIVELVTNNVLEPLLFGHTTGVSPTALLVSAGCWLYLWGPVGLIFSAPFAVCLVVLGKNIPQLGFLYLLLGDKPALNADYSYYQRLMLGDFHEAAGLAIKRVKGAAPEKIYDEMLIPVLNYTKRDVQRGYLDDEDQRSVIEGLRATLSQIAPSSVGSDATSAIENSKSGDTTARCRLLACPATDDADLVTVEMLGQSLDPEHWDLEISSLETLTSELIASITESPPSIIFIASIPPGGLSHARYLCKRLRSAASEIPIVVGRCGQKRNTQQEREKLEAAGASFVTTSLLESRSLLNARLPLLMRSGATHGAVHNKGLDSSSSATSLTATEEHSELFVASNANAFTTPSDERVVGPLPT